MPQALGGAWGPLEWAARGVQQGSRRLPINLAHRLQEGRWGAHCWDGLAAWLQQGAAHDSDSGPVHGRLQMEGRRDSQGVCSQQHHLEVGPAWAGAGQRVPDQPRPARCKTGGVTQGVADQARPKQCRMEVLERLTGSSHRPA